MKTCKECGVQLAEDMESCPLCENLAKPRFSKSYVAQPQQLFGYTKKLSPSQKKFSWEIISITLFSGIIATLIIDFILNKAITWSEYPITVSLISLVYVSMFTFWNARIFFQMAGSFLVSAILLILFDAFKDGIQWSFWLVIPLLFWGNIIVALFILILKKSKAKGINLIAYALLGATMICMAIEGVLSVYTFNFFQIKWSIIVASSIFPVAMVLLFLHYRLKRGRSLRKTFHI